MPTYEWPPSARFRNDYRRLSASQRRQFKRALREFIAILRAWEDGGGQAPLIFPAKFAVQPVRRHATAWEMAWAPDGRCTFEWGAPRLPGRRHVIWRRIGDHGIYDDP